MRRGLVEKTVSLSVLMRGADGVGSFVRVIDGGAMRIIVAGRRKIASGIVDFEFRMYNRLTLCS